MVRMRGFFITLFLSLSIFLVASCFIRKGLGKRELTYQYVIGTISNYDISFRFREHLEEYQENLINLGDLSEADGNWITQAVDGIKSIAINVYQTGKLIVLFLVDTLRIGIDFMLMLADFIGFSN